MSHLTESNIEACCVYKIEILVTLAATGPDQRTDPTPRKVSPDGLALPLAAGAAKSPLEGVLAAGHEWTLRNQSAVTRLLSDTTESFEAHLVQPHFIGWVD